MEYDDALELAKQNNKIIMVMLGREGCPTCEYMTNVVFKDKNVIKLLKKGYLSVHIDIHNDFIPDGLTYFGTPTFHFLDADENRLYRVDGGLNIKDFSDTLVELHSKSTRK
jgi:thioredoxin-related protein